VLGGENLDTTYRTAVRLLKLVNTLLDFSRIEAGRAQASYVPTDLASLTRDLASAFRSAICRAGLTFEVDCAELPEDVFVDHDMWEKIVLNLLSNALKFTFEGKIAVKLAKQGDQIQLSVTDTGTGIPEHELPHVFERFHRVEGTVARTHEGSGIGLALVTELVKLHGGQIHAHSKVGEGSTFTVTIPRGSAHLPTERIGAARTLASTATGAAPFVQEAMRWLPGGEHVSHELVTTLPSLREDSVAGSEILVADDNADMRDYLVRLLRERYKVRSCSDGAEALALVQKNAPDLVLTDVMMPKLDARRLWPLACAACRSAHEQRAGDHALGARRRRIPRGRPRGRRRRLPAEAFFGA
jgi:CheY-like chemotaxis protein